jgi:PAS domain S-box-containing protein
MYIPNPTTCLSAYDSFPLPVIVFDAPGELLFTNVAFRDFLAGLGIAPEISADAYRIVDIFPPAYVKEFGRFFSDSFLSTATFDNVPLLLAGTGARFDRVFLQKVHDDNSHYAIAHIFSGSGKDLSPGKAPLQVESVPALQPRIRIDINMPGILSEEKTEALLSPTTFSEIFHNDDRAIVQAGVEAALRKDSLTPGLVRILHRGKSLYSKISFAPMPKTGIVLVHLNVLENQLSPVVSESAIGAEATQTLLRNMKAGFFLADESGKCLRTNESWRSISGLTEEEAANTTWFSCVHPDDREWVANMWFAAQKSGLTFSYELRIINARTRELSWTQVNSFTPEQKENFGAVVTDITARIKAEDRLHTSERNFRALFEAVQEPLIVVDFDCRINSCNMQLAKLMGYDSPEELAGMETVKFYPSAEYAKQEWSPLAYKFLQDGHYTGIIHLKKKDGSLFEANINVTRQLDENGSTAAFIASVRDVTSELTKDFTLREKERGLDQLRAAIDHSVMVSMTDLHGIITNVNEQFATTYGYTQEELVGKTHQVINSAFHPRSFFDNLWNTILSGRIWKGEIRNRLRDGSFHWADTTIIPQLDAQGKVSHFISICYDITKFRSDYEKLMSFNIDLLEKMGMTTVPVPMTGNLPSATLQTDSYRALFSGLPSPVICLGVDSITGEYSIADINTEAEKLLFAERTDITGRPAGNSGNTIFDILFDRLSESIPQRGEVEEREVHLETALVKGWFRMTAFEIQGGLVMVLENITAHVEREQLSKEDLRKKDLLLNEVHHRMKNNLQVMMGVLKLQRSNPGNMDAVSVLLDSERRMKTISLINEILHQSMNFETLKIDRYTRELVSFLRETYRHARVSITSEVGDFALSVDTATNYGIILNELVSNAFKHAFNGRTEGAIHISLARHEKNSFMLTVKDDGVGISDNEKSSKTLGMKLIRGVVANMGGEVAIENDNGLRVKIIFPDGK